MLGRVRMQQREFVQAVVAFTKHATSHWPSRATSSPTRRIGNEIVANRIIQMDEVCGATDRRPQTMQTQDSIRQIEERKRQLQENINRETTSTSTPPSAVRVALARQCATTGPATGPKRRNTTRKRWQRTRSPAKRTTTSRWCISKRARCGRGKGNSGGREGGIQGPPAAEGGHPGGEEKVEIAPSIVELPAEPSSATMSPPWFMTMTNLRWIPNA